MRRPCNKVVLSTVYLFVFLFTNMINWRVSMGGYITRVSQKPESVK